MKKGFIFSPVKTFQKVFWNLLFLAKGPPDFSCQISWTSDKNCRKIIHVPTPTQYVYDDRVTQIMTIWTPGRSL